MEGRGDVSVGPRSPETRWRENGRGKAEASEGVGGGRWGLVNRRGRR